MDFMWLLFIISPLIAFLWVLSRLHIRLSIHRGRGDSLSPVTSTLIQKETSVNLPLSPEVESLMRAGRHDEAMAMIRKRAGIKLPDPRGEVKMWTSDDGTVHVSTSTRTFSADELPDEVRQLIAQGKVSTAIERLRDTGGLSLPDAKRAACKIKRQAQPPDDFNMPTPQPFPTDD